MIDIMPPMRLPRPDDVERAVCEKYRDCLGQTLWNMDGPTNYSFGGRIHAFSVLEKLVAGASSNDPVRILDVGCGAGSFLREAKTRFGDKLGVCWGLTGEVYGAERARESTTERWNAFDSSLFADAGLAADIQGMYEKTYGKRVVSPAAASDEEDEGGTVSPAAGSDVEVVSPAAGADEEVVSPAAGADEEEGGTMQDLNFLYACPVELLGRGELSPRRFFKNGGTNVVQDGGNVHHEKFDGFDFIVVSWTFLHLADPLGFLAVLCEDLLGPGGVLLGNQFCPLFYRKNCWSAAATALWSKGVYLGHDAINEGAGSRRWDADGGPLFQVKVVAQESVFVVRAGRDEEEDKSDVSENSRLLTKSFLYDSVVDSVWRTIHTQKQYSVCSYALPARLDADPLIIARKSFVFRRLGLLTSLDEGESPRPTSGPPAMEDPPATVADVSASLGSGGATGGPGRVLDRWERSVTEDSADKIFSMRDMLESFARGKLCRGGGGGGGERGPLPEDQKQPAQEGDERGGAVITLRVLDLTRASAPSSQTGCVRAHTFEVCVDTSDGGRMTTTDGVQLDGVQLESVISPVELQLHEELGTYSLSAEKVGRDLFDIVFSQNFSQVVRDPLGFLCRLYNEFLAPGGLLLLNGVSATVSRGIDSKPFCYDETNESFLWVSAWAEYLRHEFDCRICFRRLGSAVDNIWMQRKAPYAGGCGLSLHEDEDDGQHLSELKFPLLALLPVLLPSPPNPEGVGVVSSSCKQISYMADPTLCSKSTSPFGNEERLTQIARSLFEKAGGAAGGGETAANAATLRGADADLNVPGAVLRSLAQWVEVSFAEDSWYVTCVTLGD